MPHLAPDASTVLQLGDWCMRPQDVDEAFAGSGIERVLVALGNHEPWGEITLLLKAHPDQAVQVLDVTWLLPRLPVHHRRPAVPVAG